MNGQRVNDMDKRSFSNLIKGVRSAYPNFELINTPEGLDMWYTLLSDIPPQNLSLAFQKHIATSEYPPSIAEIRELATEQNEGIKDWSEGYGLLKRAIKNFGYYREREAMEWLGEMDPLTGTIVRRLSYQTFCLSEDEMTDRANFRMAYENQQKIQARQNQLPSHLRNQEAIENKQRMEQLTDGLANALGGSI